jgi:hypothetical protein
MKRYRRLAAFALLGGWYLLGPPAIPRQPLIRDFNAPLSQWTRWGTFDTARECVNDLLEFQKGVGNPSFSEGAQREISAMQCYASDDPRLKNH